MLVLKFATVCCWLLYISTLTRAEEVDLGENYVDIVWPDENDNKTECDAIQWTFRVDSKKGLGVNITVNELLLDSDNDVYLTITAENDTTVVAGTEATVVYLSGNLTNVRLASPFVENFYMRLAIKDPCTTGNFFNLSVAWLERRPEMRPTPPPNPNPPDTIPTEIPVHFSGKTPAEFMTITTALKQKLKQLALNFCKTNKINCDSSKPPEETVFLRDLDSCPQSWDNHNTCVKAWLAIYVTVDPKEYELTPEHLTKFWRHLEENSNLLESLGITPYEFSNISLDILWWVLWIFIAVIIAGGVGFLLWKMEVIFDENRGLLAYEEEERRKKEIFDGVTLRRPPPMVPSKHQKIPEFMLSNGDTSSILTANSTPPATKKHALRPILKHVNGDATPVTLEVKADNSSPKSPSFVQTRPSWFMFNKAYEKDASDEEDEDGEDLIFSKENTNF